MNMKILKVNCICFLLTFCLINPVFACTTFIVGKNVSADGSAYFGRTADGSETDVCSIATVEASDEEGEYIYEDEQTKFKIKLPKKHYQYFTLPMSEELHTGEWGEYGENEIGVSISATETLKANDEALKYDPHVKEGIAESNIIRIILPYIKSAKEGVLRLGEMIEKYGSCESSGVVFGDKNEIWYMEIYTGHEWVAVKCPDDKYAVIANDAMLSYVDLNDKENVLYSKNLITLPKEKGFLKEVNGKFNLSLTYNKPLRDYSQIRVWASRLKFSPKIAGEYDVNKRYEIFEKPDKKISLKELMEFTRYRFEDTKYSCDNEGSMTRPVGIERALQCHISQIRKNKPNINWVCLANSEFSVYMPFYGNIDDVADEFKVSTKDYNYNSAFWKFKSVSNLAVKDRKEYGKIVRDKYNALENKWINNISAMDEEYEKGNKSAKTATNIFKKISKEALDTADTLFSYILTDMTHKINKETHKHSDNLK